MNAKAMNYSDTVADELETIIDFKHKKEDVVENEEITALSNPRRKSLISTYITSIIKRMIDICAGLVGTIILVPLTLVIYIANRICGDKGPVFYTQDRIGKDGKIFKMLKYRSMVCNSAEILEELLKDEKYKKEWDMYQKFENDPRITKVGKILRKTSLDEVPQFINVLKGDMSLIGPRPLIEGELEAHEGNPELYESVRPGVTSYWAVNGRSDVTYGERLSLEYYYVNNMSLALDIKCIFKTIGVVVGKKGAK